MAKNDYKDFLDATYRDKDSFWASVNRNRSHFPSNNTVAGSFLSILHGMVISFRTHSNPLREVAVLSY